MNSDHVTEALLVSDLFWSKPNPLPSDTQGPGRAIGMRMTFVPKVWYDTAFGQWFKRDSDSASFTTKRDERDIRVAIIQALRATDKAFVGADIALALDLLKAIVTDRPITRYVSMRDDLLVLKGVR